MIPEVISGHRPELVSTYNAAMDEVARNIPCERKPLKSQLVSYEKCTSEQRQCFIEKAKEDSMLVCEVIAPNYGKELFNAMATLGEMDDVAEADDVLKALMSAYKNAKAKAPTRKFSAYMRTSIR